MHIQTTITHLVFPSREGEGGQRFSGPLRILYCMYFVTCNDGAATAAAAILVRSLSTRKIHAAARLACFPNCKIPMAALPRAAVAQASCFIGQLFRRVTISKYSCFPTGVSQDSCFHRASSKCSCFTLQIVYGTAVHCYIDKRFHRVAVLRSS
jgi:hypothetical protein